MLGIAHTLVAENLLRPRLLERYTSASSASSAYLIGERDGVPKTADWAAAICGVPAETIRDLARRMAAHRTSSCASWSLQRADHGEQPYWAAIDARGDARADRPARRRLRLRLRLASTASACRAPTFLAGGIAAGAQPGRPLHSGRAHRRHAARSRRAPIDFNGQRAVYPDIRLVYWAGGNPFHHHQDLNRLHARLAASRRPIMVHEPWWTPWRGTPTSCCRRRRRWSATTSAARRAIRSCLPCSRPIAPVGEARNDYDIFARARGAARRRRDFTEGRDEMAWLRQLYERARSGPRAQERRAAGLRCVLAARHPWLPEPQDVRCSTISAPTRNMHPLKTPSGKIEIFSEPIAGFGYDDCPGHAVWHEPREWLGGRRDAYSRCI